MSPAIDKPIPLAEAKDHFSTLTSRSNELGTPFTITKNGKPWVEVRPLAWNAQETPIIHITPAHRAIKVPDLDQLFGGYEDGFAPTEDGFANAVGREMI